MIVTVTLNPMLDKTVHVDSLKMGRIHRASKLEMSAGGKGINVARQLKHLGIDVVATGFLGGEVGSIVRELLAKEDLRNDFVETGVMTREGVTYLEQTGRSSAVFEPPGRIPVAYVGVLLKKIARLTKKSSWVVCSGSSPSAEADRVYYDAIAMANSAGVMSVLDSYGAAFKKGLRAAPTMIKPNREEYRTTFGKALATEKEVRLAMDRAMHHGIRYVIITDGAGPTYAASKDGHWKAHALSVNCVNPVGSGDAMVAGILFGFEKGWLFEMCLAFGVAAGAANARKWSVAGSKYAEIKGLLKKVIVKKLM